ncbi:MAG: aminotransferase class I/II-fold pyridoxal phosphate-dependent enzyme, partial [Chitinispirillia bacterium]
VIAPYFIEYINLIKGNGGIPVIINSTDDYRINIHSIERAVSPLTKAIIINSPNNPTGRVYSNDELIRLSEVLKKKNEKLKISVKVIEDSVYETILFNKTNLPSLISHYPLLFRVNSYSKSMSLSGERIGYYAIHPNIGDNEFRKNLQSSLRLNMRMRIVHAPLFQQRILSRIPIDCVTDTNYYKNNIDRLYNCITELGYKVLKPEGTFYLWATLPDRYNGEEQFRKKALKGNTPLLYLPGVFFGGSAYNNCIRFSVCVSNEVIERACIKLKEIDACFPHA